MRAMSLPFIVAITLLWAQASAQPVGEDERVQVGTFAAGERFSGSRKDPQIDSILWDKGDLRVRMTHAAPCGYHVVDPFWAQAEATIILRFTWVKPTLKTPDATTLCLQHVQAWVFRIPDRKYTVLISDSVPSYKVVANTGTVVDF